MLKLFRAISIMEGLSYLAILSVTIGLIGRDFVFQIGIGHGVLFMLYLILSIVVSDRQRWSLKIWLPLFFASIIPFAFILVEYYLRKGDKSKALEGV